MCEGEIFEPTQGVPPMTAIGNFFSDAEVAGALTYVRNSWGNDAVNGFCLKM